MSPAERRGSPAPPTRGAVAPAALPAVCQLAIVLASGSAAGVAALGGSLLASWRLPRPNRRIGAVTLAGSVAAGVAALLLGAWVGWGEAAILLVLLSGGLAGPSLLWAVGPDGVADFADAAASEARIEFAASLALPACALALMATAGHGAAAYLLLSPEQRALCELTPAMRTLGAATLLALAPIGLALGHRRGLLATLAAGVVTVCSLTVAPYPAGLLGLLALALACPILVASSLARRTVRGCGVAMLATVWALAFAALWRAPFLVDPPAVADGERLTFLCAGFVALSVASSVILACQGQSRDRTPVHASGAERLGTSLSGREREVLEGLLQGDTVRQIAVRLGLSRGSVGTYCTRIYQKAGVSTRDELLRLLSSCQDEQVGERDGRGIGPEPAVGYSPSRLPAILMGCGAYELARLMSAEGAHTVLWAFGLAHVPGSHELLLVISAALLGAAPCLAGCWAARFGASFSRSLASCVPTVAFGGVAGFCGVAGIEPGVTGLVALVGTGGAGLALHVSELRRRIELSQTGMWPTLAKRLMERGLTRGEARVALMVVRGMSARDIADELVVSRKTVASQRKAAYRRLGVHSRAELAAYLAREADAYRQGVGADT